MDVRCGKCNKLFRVSDDKISGKGIKFACTRCNEIVKITQEDYSTYALSKTAVSALDMFEPKPKTKPSASPEIEAGGKSEVKTPPRTEIPVPDQNKRETSSSIPDFLQEKEEPALGSPEMHEHTSTGAEHPFAETSMTGEPAAASDQEPSLESQMMKGATPDQLNESAEPKETKKPGQDSLFSLESQLTMEPQSKKPQASPPPAPGSTGKSVPRPEPAAAPGPKQDVAKTTIHVPVQEPKPATPVKAKPLVEPKPEIKSKVEPARAQVTPAPPVSPAMPKKEPSRQTSAKSDITAMSAEPPRSNRMTVFLIIGFILIGLAAFGVFRYAVPSKTASRETTSEMSSIEGLRVSNSAGTIEPNGDLRISGSVENSTDKERTAWYIVVDVFDAQGTVLSQLRLVNGKQIFSRKDYDILFRRGINIQELKARALQTGVVIPAKGTIQFELTYIQPPDGIASFNANLHPFDPVRLYKEIAEESK